jgi:hypothetical protein
MVVLDTEVNGRGDDSAIRQSHLAQFDLCQDLVVGNRTRVRGVRRGQFGSVELSDGSPKNSSSTVSNVARSSLVGGLGSVD